VSRAENAVIVRKTLGIYPSACFVRGVANNVQYIESLLIPRPRSPDPALNLARQ